MVRIRVGLNSGEVVVRAIGSDLHMDYTAVGQTTHLAARMEQLAEPGSILLSPATLELAKVRSPAFYQETLVTPAQARDWVHRVERALHFGEDVLRRLGGTVRRAVSSRSELGLGRA